MCDVRQILPFFFLNNNKDSDLHENDTIKSSYKCVFPYFLDASMLKTTIHTNHLSFQYSRESRVTIVLSLQHTAATKQQQRRRTGRASVRGEGLLVYGNSACRLV